jgi:hypothetical protein
VTRDHELGEVAVADDPPELLLGLLVDPEALAGPEDLVDPEDLWFPDVLDCA